MSLLTYLLLICTLTSWVCLALALWPVGTFRRWRMAYRRWRMAYRRFQVYTWPVVTESLRNTFRRWGA